MRKSFVSAFCTLLLLGAGATPAMATSLAPDSAPVVHADHGKRHTPHPKVDAVDFAGTVALSNCSGSVVRMPNSQPQDPALVLTNGHCIETGFPDAGEVITDQPSSRTFTLLDEDARSVATLRADKVVYSTMTDTDITLYELNTSYEDIADSTGIQPLDVVAQHPTAGTAITVVSGFWRATYSCNIDGFVFQMKEGVWTWKDSIRYTPECQTIGGTSGSPVVNNATGQMIAINNTGNEDGQQCTLNNPCEVAQDGTITVRQGINYAQETYIIPPCIGTGNKLDLSAAGCTLPKP